MGEWVHVTLGEVVELKRGYDLPQQNRRAGKIPVVSSSGVTAHHSVSMVPAPGVVTGRYGTIGQVFYISQDFWPLNTTLYVRDFKGNDPRFVGYLLRTVNFLAYSDKGAVPGVNRNHLHQAQVVVPVDLAEQRAIAQILGALEDKIELNRRMSETLEGMARALFKSWFVDFDPVRAKAEGRDPGLPGPLVDLFPSRFVDSDLGRTPEGWPLVPLPALMEINPRRSLRKGDSAPYLDMSNMPTMGHCPDDVMNRLVGSGMRFVNGDTLVARITPCLENGKTAYVDFLADGEVGWGSTEYIVLRPHPAIPLEFGYCLARSEQFREFAIQAMTGSSGRQRVPADALLHFQMPRAPDLVFQQFGRTVKPIFSRGARLVEESRTLATIRDVLLPRLLSGELRVPIAERVVEGVL